MVTRRRNRKRGFPGGCPLPYAVAQEVLSRTSNKHRACKVCERMVDRTGVSRERCNYRKEHRRAYGA